MNSRTVTVSILPGLRVTVDIDSWSREYGTDATAAAVRDDVKNYYRTEIVASYPFESGIITLPA